MLKDISNIFKNNQVIKSSLENKNINLYSIKPQFNKDKRNTLRSLPQPSEMFISQKGLKANETMSISSLNSSGLLSITSNEVEEPFIHPLIPMSKINNDKFKISFIKNRLKKPGFAPYNSDANHKSNYLMNNHKGLEKVKKFKPCSTSKVFQSTIQFSNPKHHMKIYKDEDIIHYNHQLGSYLILNLVDEDVTTDEDNLKYAACLNLNSFQELFKSYTPQKIKDYMNKRLKQYL